MKKITTKDDLQFRTDIELILLCKKAIRVDKETCNDKYKIEGKNSLNIWIRNNVGSAVYTVYCRFNELNDLTGIYNSKHNFHVLASDGVDSAIKEFNQFINQCLKYINNEDN